MPSPSRSCARDVQVLERDVVSRVAPSTPRDADRAALPKLSAVPPAPLKKTPCLPPKTRRGDEHVGEAVGVDVEEIRQLLVDRVGRAVAPSCGCARRSLRSPARSAAPGAPVRVERRDVLVPERHRRQRRARRRVASGSCPAAVSRRLAGSLQRPSSCTLVRSDTW